MASPSPDFDATPSVWVRAINCNAALVLRHDRHVPSSKQGMTSGPDGLIARVATEFLEMPDLQLTLPQARRFWNLDDATCHRVLGRLVDDGFLRRTPRGIFRRAGESR
jgi:hypothetical protein